MLFSTGGSPTARTELDEKTGRPVLGLTMNLELKMDIRRVEQVDQENATKKKRDPCPLPREKRQWTWEDPMWATDPNVKAYLAKPEVSWKSTDFEEGTIFRLSDPAQKAAFMNAKFVRFPPESGPASSSQRLPERRLPRASEAASSSSATYHRTAVGCMKLVNLLRRTLSVTASSSDREVSVLYLGGPAPAPHMDPDESDIFECATAAVVAYVDDRTEDNIFCRAAKAKAGPARGIKRSRDEWDE
ncbi:hypothetical protein AK812_SmicGene40791 [Symbiodinium microadriaticum]|uniref:Uncharacterized protein n=1 Tax=Symbiodinium microadriaticum TaxID=2951 RepID=A0A1Q9C7T0_SYMMI|nr:hypothetical protein AK812_SmicGene40791 [Symbiodinium microadriaticum]CAE7374089.1 unnamed protein product [Symbiodinium microadriaticum]